MLIVSACLLGVNSRFDGTSRLNRRLSEEARAQGCIPICPEQLGGLATPRRAIFLLGGNGFDLLDRKCRAFDLDGNDMTAHLISGAGESLKIARILGITGAILKEKSPSCGVHFTASQGRVIGGPGVTAALFIREGMEVVCSEASNCRLPPP